MNHQRSNSRLIPSRPAPRRSAPAPAPAVARTRRAFALPLVVLLLLVGGLTIGLLMERHSISYRAIARHVENYKSHHRAAGVKECILRWLDTARGRVDQSLDENGLAFSMEVSGEGRIDVYLRDAQGGCLADPSALSGRRREIVEDMKFLLDSIPPERRIEGIFRPVGPPEISIDTAPEIVIRALCRAVIPEPDKADAAALAIFDRRGATSSQDPANFGSSGVGSTPSGSAGQGAKGAGFGGAGTGATAPTGVGVGNIADALRDLPITERQRREIAAMLVSSPTLFECVVETRDTGNHLLNKSSGLYKLDEAKSDTFKQGGGFLTWDALPLDDDDRAAARRRN